MRSFLTLFRANLTEFLSNRRALFLTIAFPILFIVIFGSVLTNQDKADARIGVASADPDDTVAREIFDALKKVPTVDAEGHPYKDAKAAEKNPYSKLQFVPGEANAMLADLRRGRIDAVITVPADLTAKAADAKERALKAAATELREMEDMRDLSGEDDDPKPAASPADASSAIPAAKPNAPAPANAAPSPAPDAGSDADSPDPGTSAPAPQQLTLTIDPSRQTLIPVLQGILTHVLDGVDSSLTGQPRLLGLKIEASTAREVRTIDYLLPGILAMSLMQLGLFATAQPLVALRTQGVLKRLNATPLRRSTLLFAYVAFRLTVALVQTAICVAIGRYVFAVVMVGSWWLFAGWLLLGTMVFLSIGFFLAAVSKNEEVCIAAGNIINLPMILLSGVFFPVNHLSRVFDYIIPFVPLNYLGDALRQTMVDAIPIHSQGTNALVLVVWVVVMTILSVRFFTWDNR